MTKLQTSLQVCELVCLLLALLAPETKNLKVIKLSIIQVTPEIWNTLTPGLSFVTDPIKIHLKNPNSFPRKLQYSLKPEAQINS